MAISLPTAAQPLPQTPAAAQALALRAGQVVEARVVGAGTSGATQLSIGSQLVDAALSVRLLPGTLIQLLVQGSGPNTRLTVLPLSSQGQGHQATAAQAQAGTQPSSTVAPAITSSKAVPQAQIGAAASPAVSGSNQSSPLPARLEAGTVLRFQLQGTGANARPVLVLTPNPNSANAIAQGHTQNALPVPNPLQQAVAQTVQNAVMRQDSIATLLSSLAGLGAKLAELPKPVAQAGAELLASRLNLSAKPLDGAGLRQALARSGVLFENRLQQGGSLSPARGDLKAALLNLRNALRTWLGNGAPGKSVSQQNTPPPPPTPRALPRADRPVSLPLFQAVPNSDTGAKLLGQSEAALARMQLTQISSLPDGSMRVAQGPAGSASELNMELPLLFGGELSVGQFQISRDGANGTEREREVEWKMRFSINFSQTGEVGAIVSLRGGKTGVMLWAEREETATILQQSQNELEEALSARGLEPGAIRCRHGHPPQARKPVGAFMDNCS